MTTGDIQDRINKEADFKLKQKISGAFTRLHTEAGINGHNAVTLGTGQNTSSFLIKDVLAALSEKLFEEQQPGARSVASEAYMRRIDRLEGRLAESEAGITRIAAHLNKDRD